MCDHFWYGKQRAEGSDDRVALEIDGVRFEEASPDEWRAMLEESARRELGMSLAEFERAYWAGELDPEKPGVAELALLIPPRRA